MRKMLVFVALAFVALSAFAGDQDFTLINETGLAIEEFYCCPANTNDWNEDLFDGHVIEDEKECIWDFMIVDEEGEKVFWKGIDLCEAESVMLSYENGEPKARIKKAPDGSKK